MNQDQSQQRQIAGGGNADELVGETVLDSPSDLDTKVGQKQVESFFEQI